MLEQPTNPLTPFKPVDSQSHEAVERLEILFDQHAQVAEQLRELHGELATVQAVEESHWSNLESQVARLRYEIENFKQTFSPSIVPVNFIFDPEMTLNFLSLEI